jgi:CSLREA domain-containing protein
MARRVIPGLAVALVATALGASAAWAGGPPIHVTTTADTVAADADTSLREAITAANGAAGADAFDFDVGGTFALGSPLPAITEQLAIDGSTAPTPVLIDGNNQHGVGTSVLFFDSGTNHSVRNLAITNFDGIGIRGDPKMAIDNVVVGLNAAGTAGDGGAKGVELSASSSSVTNSTISGNGVGLDVDFPDSILITNNRFGTNVAGTAAIPNTTGLRLLGRGATVSGNVISGNTEYGIVLGNGARPPGATNVISDNRIGTRADGVTPLGNGFDGIRGIDGARNTAIGRVTGLFAPNVISFNGSTGIFLPSAGLSNFVGFNRFAGNGGMSLDLGGAGPTPNDAGDADGGPNGLQNFPLLTSLTTGEVKGTLDTKPNENVVIELWASDARPGNGRGELLDVLGDLTGTTPASGPFTFTFTPSPPLANGRAITAVAVTGDGTSEPSPFGIVGAVAPGGGGAAQPPAVQTPGPQLPGPSFNLLDAQFERFIREFNDRMSASIRTGIIRGRTATFPIDLPPPPVPGSFGLSGAFTTPREIRLGTRFVFQRGRSRTRRVTARTSVAARAGQRRTGTLRVQIIRPRRVPRRLKVSASITVTFTAAGRPPARVTVRKSLTARRR